MAETRSPGALSFGARVAILGTLTFVGIAAAFFFPPVPQDPVYHLFADVRTCFGVPNFGNVASNAVFVLVGIWGLASLYGRPLGARFASFEDTLPYAVFFLATMMIGAGSAYYHARPDNQTLFWDRLPMTVAFMSFVAAVVADRIHRRAGLRVALPVLLVAGFASLLYWVWTENAGRGDLRFYGLVQFLPMILIPAICWLFPVHSRTAGRYIAAIVALYAVAKIAELFDAQIYDLLCNAISGHSLKHLIAGVATACVIPMAGAPIGRDPAPAPDLRFAP